MLFVGHYNKAPQAKSHTEKCTSRREIPELAPKKRRCRPRSCEPEPMPSQLKEVNDKTANEYAPNSQPRKRGRPKRKISGTLMFSIRLFEHRLVKNIMQYNCGTYVYFQNMDKVMPFLKRFPVQLHPRKLPSSIEMRVILKALNPTAVVTSHRMHS